MIRLTKGLNKKEDSTDGVQSPRIFILFYFTFTIAVVSIQSNVTTPLLLVLNTPI
jgi:hypothetical protein